MTQDREFASRVEMFHGTDTEPFTRWTTFTVTDAFDDPLGSFDFETSPGEDEFERYYATLNKGDFVAVRVNGHLQQFGIIETKTTTFDRSRGATLRLQGKWPIAVLYQAGVNPQMVVDSTTDTQIKSLVEKVTIPFGLYLADDDDHASTIDVMTGHSRAVADTVNVKALTAGQANPHQNETCYAYLSRLLTRLGVVLRQRIDGQLIVTKPHYQQQALYSVALPPAGVGTADLFIDEVTIHDSNDGQFSTIIIRGEASDKKGQTYTSQPNVNLTLPAEKGRLFLPWPLQGPINMKSAQTAQQVLTDDVIEELSDKFGTFASGSKHELYRPGFPFKPMYLKDKSARDAKQAKNVAMLAFGLRAPKAFNISGTVPGFVSATGAVWTIDTICNVQIPQIGLNEDMWLMERTFRLSRSGGQTTDLKFLPKGWFMIGEAPGS